MSRAESPSWRGVHFLLLLLPAVGFLGCEGRARPQTDTRAADVVALRELHDQVTRAQTLR
jgi:hypothetical protein